MSLLAMMEHSIGYYIIYIPLSFTTNVFKCRRGLLELACPPIRPLPHRYAVLSSTGNMLRFVLAALLAVRGASQLSPSAVEEISASCPLVAKKCDQVDEACFQSIKTKLSPACLKLYRTAIRDANGQLTPSALPASSCHCN